MNPAAGQAEAKRIDTDPGGFLAAQDDPEGRGEPITLPDGSVARRLPGYRRWIWDGEFAGVIGLRWQPGTADLPPHVLGHRTACPLSDRLKHRKDLATLGPSHLGRVPCLRDRSSTLKGPLRSATPPLTAEPLRSLKRAGAGRRSLPWQTGQRPRPPGH